MCVLATYIHYRPDVGEGGGGNNQTAVLDSPWGIEGEGVGNKRALWENDLNQLHCNGSTGSFIFVYIYRSVPV